MFNKFEIEKAIKKPHAIWSDLDGMSGTFHVGVDQHEGIETKVVIFAADSGVNYVLAEYRKRIPEAK